MLENLQLKHLHTLLPFFFLYPLPQGSTPHNPVFLQLPAQTSTSPMREKEKETEIINLVHESASANDFPSKEKPTT